MKYGKEINCVKLERDVYSEQFAIASDPLIKNYIVRLNMDCIDEDTNPKDLARRLKLYAKRFESIARFLEKLNG